MSIDLYIGPVIARAGRFAYDTFSRQDGVRSSFRYSRVEEAHHDRRTIIAEGQRSAHIRVHVCETLPEFEQLSKAGRNPDASSDLAQVRDPFDRD